MRSADGKEQGRVIPLLACGLSVMLR